LRLRERILGLRERILRLRKRILRLRERILSLRERVLRLRKRVLSLRRERVLRLRERIMCLRRERVLSLRRERVLIWRLRELVKLRARRGWLCRRGCRCEIDAFEAGAARGAERILLRLCIHFWEGVEAGRCASRHRCWRNIEQVRLICCRFKPGEFDRALQVLILRSSNVLKVHARNCSRSCCACLLLCHGHGYR